MGAKLKFWKLILGQCWIWESLGVEFVFLKRKKNVQIKTSHVVSSDELITVNFFFPLSLSHHPRASLSTPSSMHDWNGSTLPATTLLTCSEGRDSKGPEMSTLELASSQPPSLVLEAVRVELWAPKVLVAGLAGD